MYSKTAMKQRILLTGKDGIDLLQRITTIDFKRISVGKPHSGLILNPQGKILCYFEVEMTTAPDQIEVSFDNRFLELLDQYTFGERYQIENLPLKEETLTSATETSRILSRVPKTGNEFLNNGETNPLEVNLLFAIHDQKGCYPGQEVVEKIISIGSPAKHLCLVKCTSDLMPGKDSLPLELNVGKLTSFEAPFGLAILRKTHIASGSKVSDLSNSFYFEVLESKS